MANEPEAPERVWLHYEVETDDPQWSEDPTQDAFEDFAHFGPYIRKDLFDAKDKRITDLEAQLTIALSGLHECEQEIDDYVRQEYPHDHPVQERYRQRDFSSNPARVTIAELKGLNR